MTTVITYGTFDLLHQGHLNLLRRAKELGDFLIVGVTNDKFDQERGKLNVHNNVLERVEAIKATGFADKIIIEDYVGQKIDDIIRYNVDIFAIGSDWEGHFDYLEEYCKVVYLPRTEGISSTMLRNESQGIIKIGVIGCGRTACKFANESKFVSGVYIRTAYDIDSQKAHEYASKYNIPFVAESIEELLADVDAVYIATPNTSHYELIRKSLAECKHVLCENAMVTNQSQAVELFSIAKEKNLILMEAIKTSFAPAFNHLITMIKSGVIGEVVDIDSSVSTLKRDSTARELDAKFGGGCMLEMGSYPLMLIIKLMGDRIEDLNFYSRTKNGVDIYTKGIIRFQKAVCSFKLGMGVKTEGNLVVSGTKGYAYVPSPWWKMEFYELCYEDQNDNKKFFYKFDGEGLRYELHEFISCIFNKRYSVSWLRGKESIAIAHIMEQYKSGHNIFEI